MKIRNYLFGHVADSYTYVEKIKNFFECNKYLKESNLLKSFVKNYDKRIRQNSGQISTDVHMLLKKNYMSFEKNDDKEFMLINKYIYFEIGTDEYIMICRKKLKRKFFQINYDNNNNCEFTSNNSNSNLIFNRSNYSNISNNDYYKYYDYHNLNNISLNDLKKKKLISNWNTEIIAFFPSNVNIKFFKIYRNDLFSFILERNDDSVNICYTYKNTFRIKDTNISKIDVKHILVDIYNEKVIKDRLKWKTKRRNRYNNKKNGTTTNNFKITNKTNFINTKRIKDEKNEEGVGKKKKYRTYIDPDLDPCYYDTFINNNGVVCKKNYNVIVPIPDLSKIKLHIIKNCIYLKKNVLNIEYIEAFHKNKYFFLTTKLNNKKRCSKLFLNESLLCRYKIYEEKKEDYYLNLYKSKDQKKVFLLSGNHIHNYAFWIRMEQKKVKIKNKKNKIKNKKNKIKNNKNKIKNNKNKIKNNKNKIKNNKNKNNKNKIKNNKKINLIVV
ncbi:conserved protein, unknown function [Hepatocystis sp. ex Piliocolobus tephrosceles]|nr:conserved protein, unknown function [Hepatocystis sp. ex Piliocolobus tephrosceles]